MLKSDRRILTTHVGSLPRGAALTDLLIRHELGEPIHGDALSSEIDNSVRNVVRKQVEAGVDVVSDGEQSKPGFQTYVAQRMTGFGGASKRSRPPDLQNFPDFARLVGNRFPRLAKVADAPQAIADVAYNSLTEAERDCKRFRSALDQTPGYVGAFIPAPSPGIIATTLLNAHYDSYERYVRALAAAMRKEYEYIHQQGFILQIDAPDLAMERPMMFADKSDAEFIDTIEMHVDALNSALANVPAEAVRLHCCWGNFEAPHVDDFPLEKILPVLYQARVSALSIEFANPRHQHEYAAFASLPLPPTMTLIPGVIDSTTNYVEHPEVVAKRIGEAVAAVGDRSRVIAGVDCGFGTFAGYEFVANDVVWAKLRACRQGADLASARLWGASVETV
jgi:5-methyltetrahydropteroyltriglutamate--homocysteine methyltransferase